MSTLESLGKKSMRLAKNYTKGYSETQTKIRNATSNDPGGPTSKELEEISRLSNNPNDFAEISEILEKRLNDKGRNWRHVHKSLVVVDHILLNGPDTVLPYYKDNIHLVKTLREFQYTDDKGVDQGVHVRQKAAAITAALTDLPALRSRRVARTVMRSGSTDSTQVEDQRAPTVQVQAPVNHDGGDDDENIRRRDNALLSRVLLSSAGTDGRVPDDEDPDLQRAIEESHRIMRGETEGDEMTAEEKDLMRAIRLSEEMAVQEEEKRKKEKKERVAAPFTGVEFLEGSSGGSSSMPSHQPQPENPFLLIDTSIPEESTSPQLQFASMQGYTDVSQSNPQLTHPTNSPYGMTNQLSWFPQTPATNPQMPSPFVSPQVTHSPFVPSSPYGSNNPFAAGLGFTAPSTSPSSLGTPPSSQFSSFPTSASLLTASPQPNWPTQPTTPASPGLLSVDTSEFAKLFANGFGAGENGVDTFGNVGQLRYGTGPVPNPASNNPFAQLQGAA